MSVPTQTSQRNLTDQVDHHVFVEGGPPLGGHLADVDDGLGVVSIDVEDGSVDNTSHVGRIRRRASHAGVRGEADLEIKGQRGSRRRLFSFEE